MKLWRHGLAVLLIAALGYAAWQRFGRARDQEGEALKQLAARGYSLSVGEYLRAAAADDVAAVRLFVQAGVNQEVTDAEGRGALHQAASHGAARVAEELLNKGYPVAPDAVNGCLSDAIRGHNERVLNLMLDAGLKPQPPHAEEMPLLVLAAREKQRAMIDILSPYCAEQEDEALFAAATLHGDVAVLSTLIKHGASVFAREPATQRTALMHSSASGFLPSVELLLASGSNRFSVDAQGLTALEIAQAARQLEVARALSKEPTDDELRRLDSVAGQELAAGRTVKVEPGAQLVLVNITEELLPYELLDATTNVRLKAKQEITLEVQQPIPDTAWVLRKAVSAGMFYQPSGIFKQRDSEEHLLIVKGLPTRHGALRAWVRFVPTGTLYEAAPGDAFTLAGENTLKLTVRQITTLGMTLSGLEQGQSWTLTTGGR